MTTSPPVERKMRTGEVKRKNENCELKQNNERKKEKHKKDATNNING
jgi:hypothetical protein